MALRYSFLHFLMLSGTTLSYRNLPINPRPLHVSQPIPWHIGQTHHGSAAAISL